MAEKASYWTDQRFSGISEKSDRAFKASEPQNDIYGDSTFDLLWTPDEEVWMPTYERAKTPQQDLPPTDRGKRAYIFLLCALFIEAIMWGIPLSSTGVFNFFYSQQPDFRHNPYIAVIGLLATGLPLLGAPFITPLISRWHKHQQFMIWFGWLTCTFALLAASFSTTITELILTQGLMYGLGFLLLQYAMLSMLNEWFVERRGLAYGILLAAGGLGGTGLPFLTQVLLRKFDYAWTLRGFAIAVVVLVGPILPFCRGRLRPQMNAKASSIKFKRVLSNPLFYFFSASNIFQGLAFYLPSLYVGAFANTLGLSSQNSAIVICVLNIAQIISQVTLGWLSDCTNIFALLLVSAVGSAIFGCVLWYIAYGFAHLIAFALLYGVFAGGFNVLYVRFCTACADDAPTTLWLYGVFAFERGIGYVVAGPISAALLQHYQRHITSADSSYAYRQVSIFVGACMVASSLGALGYYWRNHATVPGRFAACKLIRRTTYWRKGQRPKITIQRPASVVHYRENAAYDDNGRPF